MLQLGIGRNGLRHTQSTFDLSKYIQVLCILHNALPFRDMSELNHTKLLQYIHFECVVVPSYTHTLHN